MSLRAQFIEHLSATLNEQLQGGKVDDDCDSVTCEEKIMLASEVLAVRSSLSMRVNDASADWEFIARLKIASRP
jgi:hypothetical protein